MEARKERKKQGKKRTMKERKRTIQTIKHERTT
jgi:hypothetical protein